MGGPDASGESDLRSWRHAGDGEGQWVFILGCAISISYTDAAGVTITLDTLPRETSFSVQEVIPADATTGLGKVKAIQPMPGQPYGCRPPATQASAAFTVTGPSHELLGNRGFENGSANPAPWVTTARINNTSAELPHSGSWDAWLSGHGTISTDTLYQDVAVPSGVSSATLSFWLHIDTYDASTTAHDRLRVQIRDTSNVVRRTLAGYSNLKAGAGYSLQSFDITSFAGQTIRVYLKGTEDASLQTSFVVDDFALTIS